MKEEENGKYKRRINRKILFGITSLLLVSLSVYLLLIRIIERQFEKKLEQLSPLVQVYFSNIKTNLFKSSISILDLSIKIKIDISDSTPQYIIHFSRADFSGIGFLDALFNNKLSINYLQLSKGEIDLNEFLLNKINSSGIDLSINMPFKSGIIRNFATDETSVWKCSNVKKELLFKGQLHINNLEINHSNSASLAKRFHFESAFCRISDVSCPLPVINQKLRIKQLTLDSRQRTLRIDTLETISDTKNNLGRSTPVYISIIMISRLDLMQLMNKKLVVGNIIINEGYADISSGTLHQKKSNRGKASVFSMNKIFDEIKIDSLTIKHFSTAFEKSLNNRLNKEFINSLHFKSFSIKKFIIQESKVKFYSKEGDRFKIEKSDIANLSVSPHHNVNYTFISCKISKIHYSIPNSYRTLDIGELTLDNKKAFLEIINLKLSTGYSKFEFGKRLGHQADYIEASIKAIRISKLNCGELLNKRLMAGEIIVSDAKAYFFRDRRLPRLLKERPMPNDYLRDIPLDLHVNTLKINNASVVSEEFPKEGSQSGILKIAGIEISVSPMINHPNKNDISYSTTYVKASIMNAGLLKAIIHAPLRKNVYSIRGSIKNLNLPALNPSAENLGKFHIESGILNSLDFHFVATEEKATGEIVGEYYNLIIDRLKEKNGENKIAKISTFFLRHFIIPKNKDKSLDISKRTGKIEYDRDPTRFATFYFLKSLLDGIRASFNLGFLLPK